jgi:ribonuclease BN (tRNA processing enzyme)
MFLLLYRATLNRMLESAQVRIATESDQTFQPMRRPMQLTRRTLLFHAGAAAAALEIGCDSARTQATKTRLILLGTAGGPTPKKSRAAPSQAIIAGNDVYVVDCGNGVARQLVLAGVPLRSLRHIFITHHHSDHNADYGTLLLLAWSAGLRSRVDTWGPPPLERITRLFFEMSEVDLRVREADEGKPPLPPLVHPHEVGDGGPVMEDENVRVRCATVNHPLVDLALAYRFDTTDRSIVISGDTTRSQKLIALAHGADVLVHEALYAPAVDAIAGSGPDASALKKHILGSHTDLEEVGRIAEEAGVKTLVLSHLVPGESPPVADEVWLSGARKYFRGKVILARDLLEI